MSLEENKAVVRRLVEVFSKHDVALLDELVAPDFFDHDFQLRGLESHKQTEIRNYRVFPSFCESIDHP